MCRHIWHTQAFADIQLLPKAGMWRHIGIFPHISNRLASSCCPICAPELACSGRLACAGISGILRHPVTSSFCRELAFGGILASAAILQIGWHAGVVQFLRRASMLAADWHVPAYLAYSSICWHPAFAQSWHVAAYWHLPPYLR